MQISSIYTGQQKKCQSLKISCFPNFGALIPNPTFLNLWSRFCSVASFAVFGRKLHFRKYFEILKKKLNFSFLI